MQAASLLAAAALLLTAVVSGVQSRPVAHSGSSVDASPAAIRSASLSLAPPFSRPQLLIPHHHAALHGPQQRRMRRSQLIRRSSYGEMGYSCTSHTNTHTLSLSPSLSEMRPGPHG